MSYKGQLINDRYVLFGPQLDERTKEAISRGCPSGDDIIRSLPQSAFIPAVEEVKVVDKVVKPRVNKRAERIKRKKALAKKKAAIQEIAKPTIIETIIEESKKMSLDNDLDSILEEAQPKAQEETPEPERVTQADSSDNMRQQILGMLANDENAPSLEEIESWKDQIRQTKQRHLEEKKLEIMKKE